MQTSHSYVLTISDLFTISGGLICGAEAEVAIFDGETEIDRVKFCGKVGPGGKGCRRSYSGKPGLTAQLVSGPGQILFGDSETGSISPVA